MHATTNYFVTHRQRDGVRKSGLVFAFLLMMALSVCLSAQPIRVQQDMQAVEALHLMYNMDFAAANQLFTKMVTERPFHPLAPLGALATEWMLNQENYGYSSGNRILFERIDVTLRLYRKRLSEKPGDAELLFYTGVTAGLKARLQLAAKNWLAVITNGLQALSYIRQAQKANPDFCELHLPFGVFSYYVGLSSGYMKIASWILQISGSRTEGLKRIETAAKVAQYGRWEARGILAMVNLYYEGDFRQALNYASALAEEFPRNPYYHFLTAEALMELRRPQEAVGRIRQIESLLPQLKGTSAAEYKLRLKILNGTLALLQNDLRTAERELQTAIKDYNLEMDVNLGYAWLRLGQVYDLTDRPAKANQCYQRAVNLNNRTRACTLAREYVMRNKTTQDKPGDNKSN